MNKSSAAIPRESLQVHHVRGWLKSLPHALSLLIVWQLGGYCWEAGKLALRMDGKAATIAWLTLALTASGSTYIVFLGWFFLNRRMDRYLALGPASLSYGHSGLIEEFPWQSLQGLKFGGGTGRKKSWSLTLQFSGGNVAVKPDYEDLRGLFATVFQSLGMPLFDGDPRRVGFLWQVLRTEIGWESLRIHWWRIALASAALTWFGKLLAEASPATDERIDLWLALNALWPLLAHGFAQWMVMRKWKKLFLEKPGFGTELPPGFSANVYRKVILGATLIYLVIYFLGFSDLMLNS